MRSFTLLSITAAASARTWTINWATPTTGNNGANSQIIGVNDQVRFVWQGEHNVAQSGKDVFDSCSQLGGASVLASSELTTEYQTIFGGGSEGTHYYVCTIGDHCAQGQKIAIKVVPEGDPSIPQTGADPEPSGGTDIGLVILVIAIVLLLAIAKLPAAVATARIIAAESSRVRQLPAEEQASIGAEFTSGDAVWEALSVSGSVGDGGDEQPATLLLRASWLRTQHASSDRLPKRGDALPPEATIGVPELQSIHAAATGRSGRGQTLLPLLVLSHFWRSPAHPDPDGVTLSLVVSALDARWPEFEACGVRDLGVFYDFSSLFQHPRTSAQSALFKQALAGINLWYAHQLTTCWLVADEPHSCGRASASSHHSSHTIIPQLSSPSAPAAGHNAHSYHTRGWCAFEFALANVLKVSNTSLRSDWPQVVDVSCEDFGGQTTFLRPAPAEPLAFYACHEHGDKRYTNGADRDAIVAPTFCRTIFAVLGGVRELIFNRQGWGDPEASQLAVVLPLCRQLSRLELVANSIGDRGVGALAAACASPGVLPLLRYLKLAYNPYASAGLQALARALKSRDALPSLLTLSVAKPHSKLRTRCAARGVNLIVAGSQRANFNRQTTAESPDILDASGGSIGLSGGASGVGSRSAAATTPATTLGEDELEELSMATRPSLSVGTVKQRVTELEEISDRKSNSAHPQSWQYQA